MGAIRRTGTAIIRQLRVPQATNFELRDSVQEVDAAYRTWASCDRFFQKWILIKFCNVVDDVDGAMSMLGSSAVSDEFREKALDLLLPRKMKAMSLQEEAPFF